MAGKLKAKVAELQMQAVTAKSEPNFSAEGS